MVSCSFRSRQEPIAHLEVAHCHNLEVVISSQVTHEEYFIIQVLGGVFFFLFASVVLCVGFLLCLSHMCHLFYYLYVNYLYSFSYFHSTTSFDIPLGVDTALVP